MTALFMIIGGAAGGGLGWLFDRATERSRAKSGTSTATDSPSETRA